MNKLTFEQRCTVAQQCLPPAPYRDQLTVLHTEMLARIAEMEVCWSACEGLDIDHLERFGLGSATGSEIHRLREQNAELLAELKRLRDAEAEWAALSQNDGKAQREIDRLRAAQQKLLAWVWNPASEAWERVHVFGLWQPGAVYAFGPTPPSDPKTEQPEALRLAYPGGCAALFDKLWHLTFNCVTAHAGNAVHTDLLPMQEMREFLEHLCCIVDSPPAGDPAAQARIVELESEAIGYQAELAGHESSIAHFERIIALQGELLKKVKSTLSVDDFGVSLEDGENPLLDEINEHFEAINTQPTAKPVEIDGINPSKPTGPVLLWDGARWVRAEWVERFAEEDQSDGDWFEYDENDVPYVPAGWYELQDHGGDAMKWHIVVPDDAPWMPLPPKPESHKTQGEAQ